MFDQPQKWFLVLTFSMLTGPFFEPSPEPKTPAPSPWQPPCDFNSTRGVLPVGSTNTTHGRLVEQTGPLLGHYQGIVVPNIGLLTMEPVRTVVADPLFPSQAAPSPSVLLARPSSIILQKDSLLTMNNSLLRMKAVPPETWDLSFLPPAPPPSPAPPSQKLLRQIFPSRISLIGAICYGVGAYFIDDLMVVLAAVLASFGVMTRKIKATFCCLKDRILAKIKMIQWPRLRPHRSDLEVVVVEPSQLPGNKEEDDNETTDTEVAKARPKDGRVTVIFPTPERLLNPRPEGDKEEGKDKDNLDEEEEENALPQDAPEKDSAEEPNLDDTTEVLVFKVKNGLMGRMIGKKGSIVKTMKRDLKLYIMYGSLDVGYSFFRVEGPASGVSAAKTICCQRVQSGMEEIDPTEIEHRVSQERIISVQYTYSRWHHGRVVGKDGRCLKELRAMDVRVAIITVGQLNHIELTGTTTNIREAQLWIMENLNTPLFVAIPELIEAPEALPQASLADEDEGASASAAAEPE